MRVSGLTRRTQRATASDDEWRRLFQDAQRAAAAVTPTTLFDCRLAIDPEHPAPTYALARTLEIQRAIPCSVTVRGGSSIEYALQLYRALRASGEWAVVAIASDRDYGVLFVTDADEEVE